MGQVLTNGAQEGEYLPIVIDGIYLARDLNIRYSLVLKMKAVGVKDKRYLIPLNELSDQLVYLSDGNKTLPVRSLSVGASQVTNFKSPLVDFGSPNSEAERRIYYYFDMGKVVYGNRPLKTLTKKAAYLPAAGVTPEIVYGGITASAGLSKFEIRDMAGNKIVGREGALNGTNFRHILHHQKFICYKLEPATNPTVAYRTIVRVG